MAAEHFIKTRPLMGIDTKLCDIPREWLELVEPRVTRRKDTSCWLWDGAVNQHGEAVIKSKNAETGAFGNVSLKFVIARLFWMIDADTDIYHECGTMNCVNPMHFFLTRLHHKQADIHKMMRRKQLRIERYGKLGK
jgi:hypothetical protein